MPSDAGFTIVLLLSMVPVLFLLWFFGPGSTKRREASVLKEQKPAMTTNRLFDENLRQRIPVEDGRALAYLIVELSGCSDKRLEGVEYRVQINGPGTLLLFGDVWELQLQVNGLLILQGTRKYYEVYEPDLWPSIRSKVLEIQKRENARRAGEYTAKRNSLAHIFLK
jgi:hypothetical protein